MKMVKPAFDRAIVKKLIAELQGIDRKMLIQIGVIFGVFIIFIFAFFLPILMQNRHSSKVVRELRMMIQGANIRIARVPEMRKQKEKYGARVKQMRGQFFDPQEIDQIIKVISASAIQNGVRITSSKPSTKTIEFPPPFNQTYVPASYELTVEGSYHSLGYFINNLELYEKSFGISDIHIQKNDPTPGIHQCNLILTAFLKRSKT